MKEIDLTAALWIWCGKYLKGTLEEKEHNNQIVPEIFDEIDQS